MNALYRVLILSLLPLFCVAQDPGYSQFFANPLHLNPAFAGTSELPRLVLNYRNQWPQQGNTFSTYSFSYDFILKNTSAGLGVQFYHDRELNGVVTTNSAAFSYSYHIQTGKESFVSLGLSAGISHKQFDISHLIFPSEIDQLSGQITNISIFSGDKAGKTFADFGIGALGQYRKFFWGSSVMHINQPEESIVTGDNKSKLPIKVTAHAGIRTRELHHGLLSREYTLSPNLLYQQQGSFRQLNMGIYMIEKVFLLGGWFRHNFDPRPDAFIATLGFAREKFQFGYSYDYTLSRLSSYSSGSHEISLTFFPGEKPKAKPRGRLLIPML